MNVYLNLLTVCFLFSACQTAPSGENDAPTTTLPVVQAKSLAPTEKGIVSEAAIGTLQLNMPMQEVNQQFKNTNDFSINLNDKDIAAKRVTLSNGEYIVVEDGNQDGKIDRISTNGAGFVSKSGYNVGTKIKDILSAGERITIGDEDGIMVLRLEKEKISVYIDGYSEEMFYQKDGKTIDDLPATAHITEISIAN